MVPKESPHIPGAMLVLPSAMTMIIPAWKISELLDAPKFEEMRNARDAIRRANSVANAT
jgi:hypothetical protein